MFNIYEFELRKDSNNRARWISAFASDVKFYSDYISISDSIILVSDVTRITVTHSARIYMLNYISRALYHIATVTDNISASLFELSRNVEFNGQIEENNAIENKRVADDIATALKTEYR